MTWWMSSATWEALLWYIIAHLLAITALTYILVFVVWRRTTIPRPLLYVLGYFMFICAVELSDQFGVYWFFLGSKYTVFYSFSALGIGLWIIGAVIAGSIWFRHLDLSLGDFLKYTILWGFVLGVSIEKEFSTAAGARWRRRGVTYPAPLPKPATPPSPAEWKRIRDEEREKRGRKK